MTDANVLVCHNIEEGMADKNATVKDPTDEPLKVQTRSRNLHDEESLSSFKITATAMKNLEIPSAKDMSTAENTASQHQGIGSKKAARKKAPAKFEKAPEAPKRFKSAFILFSAEKHKLIRAQMGERAHKQRVREICMPVTVFSMAMYSWSTDKRHFDFEDCRYFQARGGSMERIASRGGRDLGNLSP